MMLNSILINKTIYKLLSTDDRLKALSKGHIYPLIANEGTQFPFIVYSRSNINTEYCKDGVYEDNVLIDIICVSNDYTESIEIANRVRNILDNIRYKDVENDIYISECRVSSITEFTTEYSFIQQLTFNIKVN